MRSVRLSGVFGIGPLVVVSALSAGCGGPSLVRVEGKLTLEDGTTLPEGTRIVFNPVQVADNLKKGGGFIPGIRPGKNTAQYIEKVLTRITFAGAIYLSVVCMIPAFLMKYMSVPFQFGGTGLLIVVGVALDTVQQIESHLITRNYEGFTGPKGPRIRGRAAGRPAPAR